MFIGRVSLPGSSHTNILSGLVTSGKTYEIQIVGSGTGINFSTDSLATSGPSGTTTVASPFKFSWDDTPLYAYNSGGSASFVDIVVVEVTSTVKITTC